MELGPIPPVQQRDGNQSTEEERKLRKVSQDFEAIFLNLMLKSMRKSVPESGFLPNGAGHDIYRQVFDEEIARSIARSRGFGLSDVIYRELSKASGQKSTLPGQGQGNTLRGLPPSEEGR